MNEKIAKKMLSKENIENILVRYSCRIVTGEKQKFYYRSLRRTG